MVGRMSCSYGYRPTLVALIGTLDAVTIKPLTTESNLLSVDMISGSPIIFIVAIIHAGLMASEVAFTPEVLALSLILAGMADIYSCRTSNART